MAAGGRLREAARPAAARGRRRPACRRRGQLSGRGHQLRCCGRRRQLLRAGPGLCRRRPPARRERRPRRTCAPREPRAVAWRRCRAFGRQVCRASTAAARRTRPPAGARAHQGGHADAMRRDARTVVAAGAPASRERGAASPSVYGPKGRRPLLLFGRPRTHTRCRCCAKRARSSSLAGAAAVGVDRVGGQRHAGDVLKRWRRRRLARRIRRQRRDELHGGGLGVAGALHSPQSDSRPACHPHKLWPRPLPGKRLSDRPAHAGTGAPAASRV